MSRKEKVTVTLPAEVMDAVREEAPPRGQSQFIAEAVIYFVEQRRRQALRERLVAGYQASAARDQALAEEWRVSEDEAWEKYLDSEENEA